MLSDIHEASSGLVARLRLAGPPCNAFGTDIDDLTVMVTYETPTRLHVVIEDTATHQFRLPTQFFPRPIGEEISAGDSDLAFNYEPSPFAFWITRKATGDTLFDTRLSSLPTAPTKALDGEVLDGFQLVFEDRYLQLTSALPLDANIYGLGEAVATSGFRRDISQNGTIQTMWARDAATPEDENMYGSHPVYLEHRINATTGASASHAVFLSSAAGADVLLTTPRGAKQSLVQYRLLGGVLDFYFFAGPTPIAAIEQYGALAGRPAWVPYWAFGFHLCRWGYADLADTRAQVERMRAASIPLEVMWNDIELYHDLRDFTTDPVGFPPEDVRAFIRELAARNQRYIPILDAAIPHVANDTDEYLPFLTGFARDVFVKNPDKTTFVGQVWPGYTVFPDWFAGGVEEWWGEAIANWSALGVEFAGLWLDMNEPASFCAGSCGTGADLTNTTPAVVFPGEPGNLVTDWPEGYDAHRWGTSGNISVDGLLTFGDSTAVRGSALAVPASVRRATRDPNDPPYAIHNGWGDLAEKTLAPNATYAGGIVDLDAHNIYGYMEERATFRALRRIRPDERPFLISRSTFASSGHWSGHWLGDNFSKWSYLRYNIQGVLQFQLFQIPMVGADTCGFNGNTDEELCNRWMSLSAFVPFYRNHNVRGAISQEPYRWDSVALASRAAIAIRYAMLPYWYTLFADVATNGTPPMRALFFEFPDEAELLSVDLQFMIGSNVLVAPVTTPNVSTVTAILPGRGHVIWREWYKHLEVAADATHNSVELNAPLGHIPVLIRGGSALLLHAQPAYTTAETRAGPYTLLISLDATGAAFGHAYVDDGISPPDTVGAIVNRTLRFDVSDSALAISSSGAYIITQTLTDITVLGVLAAPSGVRLAGGLPAVFTYEAGVRRLNITGLALSLNENVRVSWA
ncbi:glycosyl hydrolases family 31-domain-containing protein [Vararia minispora EC-137]|uniref:Glycosyl hydrolases family 31-domain-containing protein n=1 Tax=Vararia minispora EC-137 TaxID=1314806 RepID=A0ACB8QR12_9AGAM|nr:glycosyl hydrolases family 31-domain-containing protein [Vararia minispora EC-137]